MKRSVMISYDDNVPDQVLVGTDEQGDPWSGLAMLIEGVGVLVKACSDNGITEHNGQPLNEYLKDYIDKVCHDYGTPHKTN